MKKLLFTFILFHLITAPVFAHHNGIHHHHSELTMHQCMLHSHYHGHQDNLNTLKAKPSHNHKHVNMVDFFLEQKSPKFSVSNPNREKFSLNFWLPNPLMKDFFHKPQM